MTDKELAQAIVDEIDNMFPELKPEDYAPASEVQKWLDASDLTGNAEAISKEVYKIIEA